MGKTTSYVFPKSPNGRHLVTVRFNGWTFANVHSDSGSRPGERKERLAQFDYMSLIQESEPSRVCVLAGDFNARNDEDIGLRSQGWRDSWADTINESSGADTSWTWRRGIKKAR